jgi:hypothetical protein
MIGCGGSGQKAVRYVRDSVRRRLEHSGWDRGIPQSWRFLGLDTLNIQESPGEIPTLPAEDYKSISLKFGTYPQLTDALLAQHSPRDDSSGYRELIGWRPNPAEVHVPLLAGAGKMRAVGRIAGVMALDTVVREKITEAFSDCDAGGPELQQVSQHLGIPVPPGTAVPDPMVVVLGSMAGGTGAGILLDVIDLIRRTDERGAFPIAVIFTADIFNAGTDDAMAANGLAMMSELMSAYWDTEISYDKLIPTQVRCDNRGPHSTFLIGRKNLRGIDLEDQRNVYRAVGETLGSWVSSISVQESIYNFITVNWAMNAPDNNGGYPFDPIRQPGVVSSFGSSTISIGRDRFQDYSSKLIMREVLDGLYEGHNKKAVIELGEDAKNMNDVAILEEIVSSRFEEYLSDCHLDERGTEANQVTDRFASRALATEELKEIKSELKLPFETQSGTPAEWHQRLGSQAAMVEKPSQDRADSGFNDLIRDWGPESFERILEVTSRSISRYGLKVGELLVGKAVNEVLHAAAEVHQECAEDLEKSAAKREEAKSTLRNAGTDGALNFGSAPVQAAFDQLGQSILFNWRASRRKSAANAMAALANEILTTLMAQISQAHGLVHALVTRIDGQPALTESWPTYRGGVPESFSPSPLEFFLEDAEGWEAAIEDLADEATNLAVDDGYQSVNSIDATRYLINMGGFPADERHNVLPILWSKSEKPQWVPGANPQIVAACTQEQIEDRVTSWMRRPSSPMSRYFSEGLREYLNSTDRYGKPIGDHTKRLALFRQKLSEAKNQSAPLVELNDGLNAVVHRSQPIIKERPLLQGFPFTIGHPARDVVTGVMGEGSHFTDNDRESVLISSFIEHPFHPMIVNSFVQPLSAVLNRIGTTEAALRGGFWRFRRTKTLQDFIPLPDDTRLTMIRGFAVARMLGYATADPAREVSITGTDGPHRFPFPLLTDVSQDNILPALLEAFVKCYGTVQVQHGAAFAPYERLYQLGEGSGKVYTLHGEAETFLREGTTPFTAEDQSRYERACAETEVERTANLVTYLEENIKRFKTIEALPFSGQEIRNSDGTVTPEDSMTIELIDDLIRGYNEVLTSLKTRSTGSVV